MAGAVGILSLLACDGSITRPSPTDGGLITPPLACKSWFVMRLSGLLTVGAYGVVEAKP